MQVPDCTVEIFKIGSCAPAAMLFDAVELYEKHDSKADDNIRGIRESLVEAVNMCIEAAAHEFNVELQQQLLRAASYGRCFLEFHSSDRMIQMISNLRVLNAVRDPGKT